MWFLDQDLSKQYENGCEKWIYMTDLEFYPGCLFCLSNKMISLIFSFQHRDSSGALVLKKQATSPHSPPNPM